MYKFSRWKLINVTNVRPKLEISEKRFTFDFRWFRQKADLIAVMLEKILPELGGVSISVDVKLFFLELLLNVFLFSPWTKTDTQSEAEFSCQSDHYATVFQLK